MAVDSEHYTDGSIDTAHIADNQVTLGKIGRYHLEVVLYTVTLQVTLQH